MLHDRLTFGLAFAAFALLALDAALRWRRRRFAWLLWAATAIAAAHIGCVWAFRFDWDAGAMWAKNPFAFLLFHGAAACLAVAAASVAAALLPRRSADREPERDRSLGDGSRRG